MGLTTQIQIKTLESISLLHSWFSSSSFQREIKNSSRMSSNSRFNKLTWISNVQVYKVDMYRMCEIEQLSKTKNYITNKVLWCILHSIRAKNKAVEIKNQSRRHKSLKQSKRYTKIEFFWKKKGTNGYITSPSHTYIS